jgi:hypothetical protein
MQQTRQNQEEAEEAQRKDKEDRQWGDLFLASSGAHTLNNKDISDHLERDLAPVHTAQFDGEEAGSFCLSGTRVDLLNKLVAWAEDVTTPPVLWLSGLAGTGKSTVARSFCERLHEKTLVASFFISRNSADRKSAKMIIKSLIYQLGIRNPQIRSAFVKIFRDKRDIAKGSLRLMIQQLVEKALGAEKQETPIILAIDALDECDAESGREGGDLLPLLAFALQNLSGRV